MGVDCGEKSPNWQGSFSWEEESKGNGSTWRKRMGDNIGLWWLRRWSIALRQNLLAMRHLGCTGLVADNGSRERIQSPPTPGSCRFPYSRSGRISFVSIAMRHCCSVARRRSMVRRLDDTDGRTWCGVCTFGVYNGNTHSRKIADLISGFWLWSPMEVVCNSCMQARVNVR